MPGQHVGDCLDLVVGPARQVGALESTGRRPFSFVPRCQGLCGSAKKTGTPVSTLMNWAGSEYTKEKIRLWRRPSSLRCWLNAATCRRWRASSDSPVSPVTSGRTRRASSPARLGE
jgi:hypothetical protein